MEMRSTSESPETGHRTNESVYRAAWMIFVVLLAGEVWLGLAGMMLGTTFALAVTGGAWNEEIWYGPTLGVALGAHCGLWAGAVNALAPANRRTTLTTIAAGMANPLIYSVFDWFDGPMGLAWWLVNGTVLALPFMCGWFFARAMEGTFRLPLLPQARAALAVACPVKQQRRFTAAIVALVFGYVAVAVLTVTVAYIGVLLPLAPSGIPGD